MIPSHIQSIIEMILEGLYTFFGSVMGHHIKKAFPVLCSLFLFIIIANWLGLLPGVGTIGFYEKNIVHNEQQHTEITHEDSYQTHDTDKTNQHQPETLQETKNEEKKFVPLLRGATADLNTTLALAIIAFFSIQYYGFATLGITYSKRFFNFSNPIMFFVGLLEIISDMSKVVSFAFRLFGNIFAGEVLLAVMAFLMPFVAPMPFLLLELFVGFIQALVFSTLTAVFINVAVAHEE